MAQIPESYEGEFADAAAQQRRLDAAIIAAGPPKEGLAGWLGWDADWRAAKARHSGKHSLADTPWWLMPSHILQDAISKGIGFSPERSVGRNIKEGGVNVALAAIPGPKARPTLKGGGVRGGPVNVPPRGSTMPKQQVTAARTARGLRRARTRQAQQEAAAAKARAAEQRGLETPQNIPGAQAGRPVHGSGATANVPGPAPGPRGPGVTKGDSAGVNLPAITGRQSTLGAQRLRHALGGGRGDTVTGSVKDFPRPAVPPAKPPLSQRVDTLIRVGRGTAATTPATPERVVVKPHPISGKPTRMTQAPKGERTPIGFRGDKAVPKRIVPGKGGHTPTAAELASANPATQQAALSKLAELAKILEIPMRVKQAGIPRSGGPMDHMRNPLMLTGPKATRTGWLKDNWGKIATTLTLLGAGGELTRRLTKDEAATVTKANGILADMKDQPVNAEVDARLSEEEGTVVDKNGEVKEKRLSGRGFYLKRATIHKEFVQENLAAGSDLSSLDAEGASEKLYDMARYHDGIVTFSPRANKFVVVDPRTWREVKKWSHRQKQRYDKDNRLKANMERVRGNLPYYENLAEKKRQRNVDSRIKKLRKKGGYITEVEMDELHSLQTGQTDRTHPMRLLKMGAFNNKNGTVNWGEYRKYEALHETKKTEPRPLTEEEKMVAEWRWNGGAFKTNMNILIAEQSAAIDSGDKEGALAAKEAIIALKKKATESEKEYLRLTSDIHAGPAPYVDPRHDDKYKTPLHRMIDTIKGEGVAVDAEGNEFVEAPNVTEEGEPKAEPLKMIDPATGKKEGVAPSTDAIGLEKQFGYLSKGRTVEEDTVNLRAIVTALESDPELAVMFERHIRTGTAGKPATKFDPAVPPEGPRNIKSFLDKVLVRKRKTKHGTDKESLQELSDLKIRLYQAFGMAKKPVSDHEEGFWGPKFDVPPEALTPDQREERRRWYDDYIGPIIHP